MSEQDFEKGKHLLIEGMEALVAQYLPYMKLAEGAHMLGIGGVAVGWKPEDATLMRLVYETLLSGLKSAESAEEIERVMEENRQFFNLTFEHRDKEEA